MVDDNDDAPLKMRVSHNGTNALLSLGVCVKKTQFNPKSEKIEKHPNRNVLNNYITSVKLEAEQIIYKMDKKALSLMSAVQLKNELEKIVGIKDKTEDENLFANQFRKFIGTKTKVNTIDIYKFTLKRLSDFASNIEKLRFEDIDVNFLNSFNQYLSETSTKQNGRNIHLRNIRAVFNYAIDNDVTTAYPFRRFKIKPQQTAKRAMTINQLRAFINYDCEDYLIPYRDMFTLTFFLIGINTIDLVNIKELSSSGRIEYDRAKTNRHYSIKVEQEALDIINKYRGKNYLLDVMDRYKDYRDYRKRLNDNLKRIGSVEIAKNGKKTYDSEFPYISMYWARHTWATIAAKLDIPKETIAHALGHGCNTVTDIYIDFDQEKVDDANRKVIDFVLYNKR